MSRRIMWVSAILLVMNLAFMGFVYGQSLWITKIDDEKVSFQDFLDAYRAVVLFGLMNSPASLSEEDIEKVLGDKDRRKLFLRSFEDEYLILRKARETGIYDEEAIEEKVKIISGLIKRQLIIKEFRDKYILKKVKVKNSDVDKVYNAEIKRENSRIRSMSKAEAKTIIKRQLKMKMAMDKLKSLVEKYRLESRIIRNQSVLDK
ncbi:MAG: hypothetical protein OEZ36_11410 [Spirochaetota bacterium]|nr:hypothetical protein [Spirochaetota bacterium]